MAVSGASVIQTGGVEARRVFTQPALHDDLMGRLMDRANMRQAWKRVKANKGAPGSDGMTPGTFLPSLVRTGPPSAKTCLMGPINLRPIFDPEFSESSFGFRPGRSAHVAVRQVQRYIGEGYRFAVELDLEKFFDRVNHDVLMARVARKVRDKSLLGLIGRYLRAGVLVGDIIQATELGKPQGGLLSPFGVGDQ